VGAVLRHVVNALPHHVRREPSFAGWRVRVGSS
jgi:hypothetical protein